MNWWWGEHWPGVAQHRQHVTGITTSHSTGGYRTVYAAAAGIPVAYTTYILTGAGEHTGQSANFTGAVGPVAVTGGRGNAGMDKQGSGTGTLEVQPAQ